MFDSFKKFSLIGKFFIIKLKIHQQILYNIHNQCSNSHRVRRSNQWRGSRHGQSRVCSTIKELAHRPKSPPSHTRRQSRRAAPAMAGLGPLIGAGLHDMSCNPATWRTWVCKGKDCRSCFSNFFGGTARACAGGGAKTARGCCLFPRRGRSPKPFKTESCRAEGAAPIPLF
jgi:hypothetical protein